MMGDLSAALARPAYAVILINSLSPIRCSSATGRKKGDGCMVEPMLIDLRALLVEKDDCDAGTVQKVREALAQGGNQFRSLRDVVELLKKKLESATGAAAKRWHLKLGIANFFLGHTAEAAEQLRLAEG